MKRFYNIIEESTYAIISSLEFADDAKMKIICWSDLDNLSLRIKWIYQS